MACKIQELFRLQAVDGDSAAGAMTGDPATLLVYNPLSAPIYIRFGSSVPSAASHDLACPGQGIMAWPVQGPGVITAVIDYAGAVPGTDLGEAIIRSSEATLGAFVGPLV